MLDNNSNSSITADVQALDADHHMHPFTNTGALNKKGARVITHADGVYLWDSEGNKILDGMAGLWCVNMGYGRTELIEAANEQMKQLPYYNTFFQTTHAPVAQLAKEIASVTPGDLNHIFFANSGSEAIDTIMRMVRQYWSIQGKPYRNIIIARENAYHGSTIGGTSLGGMGGMHNQGGPLVPNISRIRQPYWYGEAGDMTEEEFGIVCAKALEDKILEVGPDNVAAFVGEPIQGAGGVIVPPANYWAEIQKICTKYDVLLVADEVICGFGRTGSWFGCETLGFMPDIMSMAKGLSSGYLPIAAVAVGDRIANAFIEHDDDFNHGFTYSGHPVAAAVAIANIQLMKKDNIIDYVAKDIGPYFQQKLRETIGEHPLVGHIEGIGLVAGIALVKDKATKAPYSDDIDIGMICREHCFENGLIMRAVGNRMVLSPPLIISHAEVDELCEKVRRCFDLTLKSVS
ncbi:aspartate aminotransferase family protein [Amphritea sp. 2_MG-2023]|uniref:aspartate aminotransferase family protein n=1 Tax=Amphritea TaxID=515417 RepID=UPI001C07DD36|nr:MULTISPECIES: aspartate aminotransferase family protein [Amphritea]MBU2966803.1 aspartate aminotransferase family protein [Amphritea atlantica]MDO6420666.1 aspartate aminotransferase family protein [Amphritea sp. 2_MG-2023]MDX2423715.1 aspartate aminotransferase family protein [Amphritea sp.]